jgi:hypothetical protein
MNFWNLVTSKLPGVSRTFLESDVGDNLGNELRCGSVALAA